MTLTSLFKAGQCSKLFIWMSLICMKINMGVKSFSCESLCLSLTLEQKRAISPSVTSFVIQCLSKIIMFTQPNVQWTLWFTSFPSRKVPDSLQETWRLANTFWNEFFSLVLKTVEQVIRSLALKKFNRDSVYSGPMKKRGSTEVFDYCKTPGKSPALD